MKVKKQKRTKKCVIKRRLKFQDYKSTLEAAQTENKVNHLKRITLIQIVLKKIKKNSQKVIN